jgi:cyclic pyranopterin phosphate synthase
MSERMRFLPRTELLTLEELDRLCSAFIERGVRRLRFTGGEPLVRKGFLDLLRSVRRHLGEGLDEITLTTNGVQLEAFADVSEPGGVKRIDRSLTKPSPVRRVLSPGIENCLLTVKINTVG